jgi:hypothetical protein
MPHINPEILLDQLESLNTILTIAWDISKNHELTELIEQVRTKINTMIHTIAPLTKN